MEFAQDRFRMSCQFQWCSIFGPLGYNRSIINEFNFIWGLTFLLVSVYGFAINCDL